MTVRWLTRTPADAQEEKICSREERDWLEAAKLQRDVVSSLAIGGYQHRSDLLEFDDQVMNSFQLNSFDQRRLWKIIHVYRNWRNMRGTVKASYLEMLELFEAERREGLINAAHDAAQGASQGRWEACGQPFRIEAE